MAESQTDEIVNIKYGFILPPSQDYFTQLMNFPGTNAHEPWGLHGTFSLGGRLFAEGKEVASIKEDSCDEHGYLKLDIESPLKSLGRNVEGFGVLEMSTRGGIPIEIYLSHIHRKTGVYFAYPALMFMGDVIYGQAHIEQLENSLFWPGFTWMKDTEFRLAVLNPYDIPMSFEVTIWHNQMGHHTDKVRKLSPHERSWVSIDEIMPNDWRASAHTGCSLCVTGQFKLLAYMVTVNRRTSIITSADHLHPYQLH